MKLNYLIPILILILTSFVSAADLLGIARISDPPPPVDGTLARISSVPNPLTWNRREQVVFGADKWEGPSDLSGTLYLGWDANFLYVAAKVTDDRLVQNHQGKDLWRGDHLEVFLDVPRQPAGGRDKKLVAQIGLSPGNFGEGDRPVEPDIFMWSPQVGAVNNARVAASRTSDGYQIEAAIPWETLGVSGVSEGFTLGLDVAVSDADQPSDAAQESMASLLTSAWALRDPDRQLDAALGDTSGRVDPSLIQSGFDLLQEDVRVESMQAVDIEVGAADKKPVKELIVTARMESDRIAGGNPVLVVEVNGKAMDMPSVRNRLAKFEMGTRLIGSWSNTGWFVFYAPDYKPPPPYTAYSVTGINPFEFRFDVSDLWKPEGGNRVRISHRQPKVSNALVVKVGVSERQTPKLMPPPRQPAPTGEIPVIMPAPPARPDYQVSVLAGGGVQVSLGGRNWVVESAFSTLAPGWAKFTQNPGDAGWSGLSAGDTAVTAQSVNFTIERTITRRDDHIQVIDRVRNTSGEDLPVMVRHLIDTGDGVKTYHIGGKLVEAPQHLSDAGEHPASVALYDHMGIGLLSEDDLTRAQALNFHDAGRIGIDNRRLVVAAGTTVELEFSIYPLDTADYFAFINRVRQNWNTNFTIDGSFAFMKHRAPIAGMTDDQFKTLLEAKAVHFGSATMHYYGTPPRWGHGTAAKLVDYSQDVEMFRRAKRLKPDLKALIYFHSFISTHEDDKDNFAADRLLRPDGSQGDYNMPLYPLFIPREGSKFAATQDDLIDYRFDKLHMDGIYWDEMAYSAHKYDYSDQWDGFSAEIDPRTHRIRRKIANVTLATLSWRLKAARHILDRGLLVANGAPLTRSDTQLHFPRFAETGSISNLTNTQLYTPIALGDHLTERTALDCYRSMVAGLDYGAVYYWYFDQIVATVPTLTSHMFPITPIALGPGYIIGRERILTNRSGHFGWGDSSDFEAVVFDDVGVQTEAITVPRRESGGRAFAEVRIPEGWTAAIIRR